MPGRTSMMREGSTQQTGEGEQEFCRCVECLREVPAGEVMRFGALPVCAECKPTAVAKIAKGSPLGSFWRRGCQVVVIRSGETMEFPSRCVWCNQPGVDYRTRSTSLWVNLAAWPPSIVSAKWKFALCADHARRDAIGSIITGFLITGVVLSVLWISSPLVKAPLFIGFLVASICVGKAMCYNVKGMKHRREYSLFKGCGPAFLAALPEWRGKH